MGEIREVSTSAGFEDAASPRGDHGSFNELFDGRRARLQLRPSPWLSGLLRFSRVCFVVIDRQHSS